MLKKVLKCITYVVAVLFIFSGSALDSHSNIPAVVCAICLLWLCIMAYVYREEVIK